MAKKLKKQKKGLSPKAKFTLSSAFKGIISNQAVIDGSKESPWWVAAIFFVFAVIIPLVPGFVKMSKVNGGGFLSGYNYGLDTSLTGVAYDMKEDKVQLKAKNGLLHYYVDGVQDDEYFVIPDNDYIETAQDSYRYVNSETHQIDLRVFFWGIKNTDKLSKYVNAVASQKFVRNSIVPKSADDEKGTKYYIPNIVIITPKTMAVALYKSNTTTRVQTSNGGLDWYKTSSADLVNRLLKPAIKGGAYERGDSRDEIIYRYRSKVLKQFIGICNETYLNQKNRTKWSTTGIYAGIYAGVILFLGLMIFVLTRGKTNPFKFLNVWDCQKIAWWAGFTPAVLGLILSFIFSGNAIGQMAFILLISLRVMWLSMKQLRPVYNQQ